VTAIPFHAPRIEVKTVTAGPFIFDEESVLLQLQIGNVNPLRIFFALPPMDMDSEYLLGPQFSFCAYVGGYYPSHSAIAIR
jgi:hypothetical protein